MKTSFLKISMLFAIAAFIVPSCTITVDDDDVNTDPSIVLNEMDTFGWVYSEIEFKGSGLDANCNNVRVNLSDGSVSQDLDIQDCTAGSIVAWIPEDMVAGSYDVTLTVNGNTFSSIDGTDLQVEVKIRPVVLTMDPTEVAPEGTVNITGLFIVNDSGLSQNDPQVWLMRPGYTNTVSEITVNDEGTAATIIIDDNLEPGVYDFLLTCEDWSNELQITIL